MTRLFAYKMTHDTGFAPNPFWDYLTLATCKPRIRECKKVGDWIAGFSSKSLRFAQDSVGQERLIFAMQVTEKITIQEYWNDTRFQQKIPVYSARQVIHRCGDNIYRPLDTNPMTIDDYAQVRNAYHGPDNKRRDLSGRFVLISTCFWYFGRNRLWLPDEARPTVPYGQAAHGARTYDTVKTKRFLDYLSESFPFGILAPPHSWPEMDNSWRDHESHTES